MKSLIGPLLFLLYVKEVLEVMLSNFLLSAVNSSLFFQHIEFIEFKKQIKVFPAFVTVVLVMYLF